MNDASCCIPGNHGHVMCAGGRLLPHQIYETFFALSGGASGKIVVVPSASPSYTQEQEPEVRSAWGELGDHISVFHINSRAEATALADAIESATGVWFRGGNQRILSERIVGTEAEEAILRLVFERHGICGGTSAGTSFQGETMIAGEDEQDVPYTGTGLSWPIPWIPEPHLDGRNRRPRLEAVLKTRPGRFGLGIDEQTAVVIGMGQFTDGPAVVESILGTGGCYIFRLMGNSVVEKSLTVGAALV